MPEYKGGHAAFDAITGCRSGTRCRNFAQDGGVGEIGEIGERGKGGGGGGKGGGSGHDALDCQIFPAQELVAAVTLLDDTRRQFH